MLRIDVLTLFPDYFSSPLSLSMMKRAAERGVAEWHFTDIRDFGIGTRRQVDDTPYGGGAGLVMKADVLMEAYRSIPVIDGVRRFFYLSPRGAVFNQAIARELSGIDHLILLAGHYEGVDQRFLDETNAEELSIGDFVLTGGEPAALAVIDAVVRLIPGVLGNEESTENESFSLPLLEHDHYTMPREWNGRKVPKVLISGNHAKIEAWRMKNSLMLTAQRRPDLLSKLTPDFFEKKDIQ